MYTTPGVILPSFYSSEEELKEDLRRRDEEAGHTPFNPESFAHSPMNDEVKEFIEHHGVKGMKWGIRNKSRVKKGKGGSKKRTTYSKSPKRLSSQELERRIKRMETEKKYNELNKRDVSRGSQIVNEILTNSGKKVATTVVTGALLFGIKKAVAKKLGEDAASMFTKRGK